MMNELLHNSLTMMQGPAFLAFYLSLVFIAIGWTLWRRERMDDSVTLPSMPVPEDMDPYQIAYLRGGFAEVLRLATVELFSQRVMLEETKWGNAKWRIDAERLKLATLTPIAREVADYYREARRPTDMFRVSEARANLESALKTWTDRWDAWVESERLKVDLPTQWYFATQTAMIMCALLGLGALKIISAVVREHYNVIFLGIIMFVGAIVLAIVRMPRKMSDRGRRFLKDIQLAYKDFAKLPKISTNSQPVAAAPANGGFDSSMMAMGLFGIMALQGSEYNSVHQQFARSSSTSSGCGAGCGAGASCGSGSGCGSGCGGGCGGCGS